MDISVSPEVLDQGVCIEVNTLRFRVDDVDNVCLAWEKELYRE